MFNGECIGELTEERFTTLTFVVDFENNEVRMCTSDGYEKYVMSVDFVEQSNFTRAELFTMRAGTAGAIKIGSIKAYAGDAMDK